MWEQFRILEFTFIILLILIEQIFLMSSSDLVSMFSTTAGLLGFHNFTSIPFVLCAIIPIKTYSNTEADKSKILKENTNKSGIYMFQNSKNGKRYIGSAENLKRRFNEYFNINYLLRNQSMAICCALIKHEYPNFSLTIIEYCSPDKLLIREKHYWDIFNPEYNIAKEPGAPMSGRKHSEESKTKISDAMTGKTLTDETKTKISDALTGENHPMFGKNHTEETKKIMSDTKKGEKNPMYGKNHTEETKTIMSEANKGRPRPEGAGSPFQQIEVTDIKNNTTTSYNSISEAAKALNINICRISDYFSRNQQKPYKGQYTFKKL